MIDEKDLFWSLSLMCVDYCHVSLLIIEERLVSNPPPTDLRWDSRTGPRTGPKDPGLQKPWIPGTYLGPGQIPQIYSNRLTSRVSQG
jgi:hypothetical protein